MKEIIKAQIITSVLIRPYSPSLIDCVSQLLIYCITGLSDDFTILPHSAHLGSGFVKISCKKGINMPIETIENTMLSSV